MTLHNEVIRELYRIVKYGDLDGLVMCLELEMQGMRTEYFVVKLLRKCAFGRPRIRV
jgi:hypothetical protein